MPDAPERVEETLFLSTLISFLVEKTPSLESLSRDEMKSVARGMVFDSLKDDLKKRVELEKIDYQAKRSLFLMRAAKRSAKTERIYRTALDILDEWSQRAGVPVLEMKATNADAFIDSLVGVASTVRLRVSGASSFFTFLERETDGRVRNPFRGTKARPAKKTKPPEVPSSEDIQAILEDLSPSNRAAVLIVLTHGFRVGALPSLNIWGGRYTGFSKGKEISGTIDSSVVDEIRKAGLDSRKPWAGISEEVIRNSFRNSVNRLNRAGKLKAKYSIHDIRHYFAIQEYLKDKDIYRLKTLLNHASIQVTETYLKGIENYWK